MKSKYDLFRKEDRMWFCQIAINLPRTFVETMSLGSHWKITSFLSTWKADWNFNLVFPIVFFFYNLIFILYWDRVDLQCCVSSRNTAEWFSCIYEVIGMFILFRFFPHVGYYRILSRAPCVYSWSLLIICFIPIMYLFIWNCSEDLVVPTDMHFNSLGHSVRLIWRPHFKNF